MAPNALVADEAVTLVALNTPVAPNAPVDAPSAPLAPVAPIAPIAPLASGPWTTFASTGIEVASIAKKTSTGVASVFSRAGVSLARSF